MNYPLLKPKSYEITFLRDKIQFIGTRRIIIKNNTISIIHDFIKITIVFIKNYNILLLTNTYKWCNITPSVVEGDIMNRSEFIDLVDKKIKLVRTEMDFSQEKMAEILGISKKTLIQVEKGRSSLGWTTAVTVCTIFKENEILESTFGGDLTYLIQSLAFHGYNKEYSKTLGGKIWWRDIKASGNYKIQQNIISNHFRILNNDDRRICSSLDFFLY